MTKPIKFPLFLEFQILPEINEIEGEKKPSFARGKTWQLLKDILLLEEEPTN